MIFHSPLSVAKGKAQSLQPSLLTCMLCRTPLISAGISNLSNFLLDLLFMFGFGWGAVGAGLATTAAQVRPASLRCAGLGRRLVRSKSMRCAP